MPLRDPTLLHQVILQMSHNGHDVNVSCNCRSTTQSAFGKVSYEPIEITHNAEQTKKLYNDPANHWKPFDDSWALR